MGTQEKIICRICLKICDNFKAIEGDIKGVLNKLLPNINMAVLQKPVMCINCAEMLTRCVDFKTMCFDKHDYIVPFVDNKDAVKLDLLDVYLSKNNNCTSVPDDEDICGLCMTTMKSCSAIFLNVEEGDVTLQNMIQQCLPELDLSIIKEPVICAPCRCSLEDCFRFVTNYLIVEEKIRKYCESLDINSEDQIELSNLLQFTMVNDVRGKVDSNLVDIKVEEEFCEEGETPAEKKIGNRRDVVKLEPVFCDGNENITEIEYKHKRYVAMDDLDIKDEQFAPKNLLACKEENIKLDVIKTEETFCEENELKKENIVQMEDQKFLLNEELEIKSDEPDFIRFEDGFLPQPEIITSSHTEQKCLTPNLEADLSKSSVKQTETNINVLIKTMHQCESCPFQTKYKRNLNRHMRNHQDLSEVTMFKCDSCSYETIHNDQLKAHLVKHKDPSEVTVFKCESCSYQTKYNKCLRMHLLMHKDPSELTMYQCHTCTFQTKYKYQLKNHFLIHSKVKTYKCESCSFQTKSKHYIKLHSLRHKDPSEVTMYKCDNCAFDTKWKHHLRKHMLAHSQVKTYKCDFCSFKTKRKSYIKTHLLVHKDPSEVTMYKCDSCSFQAKCKYRLNRHLILHKKPSEVTMYNCDSCLFQTKYANCLKRHLVTHKNLKK